MPQAAKVGNSTMIIAAKAKLHEILWLPPKFINQGVQIETFLGGPSLVCLSALSGKELSFAAQTSFPNTAKLSP
jgi:hypothetical protein